jgi:hypothetical protein
MVENIRNATNKHTTNVHSFNKQNSVTFVFFFKRTWLGKYIRANLCSLYSKDAMFMINMSFFIKMNRIIYSALCYLNS